MKPFLIWIIALALFVAPSIGIFIRLRRKEKPQGNDWVYLWGSALLGGGSIGLLIAVPICYGLIRSLG